FDQLQCRRSGIPWSSRPGYNQPALRLLRSFRSFEMRRQAFLRPVMIALFTSAGLAFQTGTEGPYKVQKTARVGGEGGTDYIYADTVGRRLYITRGATQAQPATDSRPEVPAFEKRLTIFNLDTLEPTGVIPGVGGNGATVCPNTGH